MFAGINPAVLTVVLLVVSNVFMTFAWYGHLKLQLKVMQEVITLVVFVVFSLIAFDSFTLHWNHYLAMLLLIAAVYLVFLPG